MVLKLTASHGGKPILSTLLVIFAMIAFLATLQLIGGQDATEASNLLPYNALRTTTLTKQTSPFAGPNLVTNDVSGTAGGKFPTPTINQSPEAPGAVAQYTIRFQTPNALASGVDKIIVLFDDEFGVPGALDRNQISIRSDLVTGGGTPNQGVSPLTVTVSFVGTENDEPQLMLTIDDMDPSPSSGANGIAAGANVTVIINQGAGVTNPTEQGFDRVKVSTTQDPTQVNTTDNDEPAGSNNISNGMFTPAIINFSSVGESRGGTSTAVASGFEGGTDLTFWRDTDADGVRDPGEIDLCTVRISSNDVATCDIAISNPPFVPGFGTDCTGAFTNVAAAGTPNSVLTAGSISACNYINAIDGEARSSSRRKQSDLNRQIVSLDGSVIINPTQGRPGQTITVQLLDYTPGALTSVTMGGTSITQNASGAPINTEIVPASGELNFTIKVPDGVPPGKQTLIVNNAGTSEDADFEVLPAVMNVVPSVVVPNQRINVSSSDFTQGGGATINKSVDGSVVTIGGEVIHTTKINNGAPIFIDNGGNWSAPIDLPITAATSGSGQVELKVIDSHGREATTLLTFKGRDLSVQPPISPPTSPVTVSGKHYPAFNSDGNAVNINVSYDAGPFGTVTATATPDTTGKWSVTITIPGSTPSPSLNTVRAEFDLFVANTHSSKSGIKVIDTTTHDVNDSPFLCKGLLATIAGTNASETLTGTPGNDVIVALGGDDIIFGFGGDDVICAGSGSDFVDGGSGADKIFGQGGSDIILGSDGKDRIKAGSGNDIIFGGDNSDRLIGNNGHDQLFGQAGNDKLLAGKGDDTASGGEGDDALDCGAGIDFANGGPDIDVHLGGCEAIINIP